MTRRSLNAEQQARVAKCTAMVDELAQRLHPRLPGVTEDELRSAGYEALVRCALRYDPSYGTPFRLFAIYRVRGAMFDTSRRTVPGLRSRLRALRNSQAVLEQAARDEAVAAPDDTRTLRERVLAAADVVAQATTAVLLSQDPLSADRLPDTADPDLALDDARLRERVQAAVQRCCSEEEQRLLQGLYAEDLSMSELGERIGRSKSTISRRHRELLQRLGRALSSD